MQAIQTKYIGPTNVRGSRVKATAQAGSVTLEWEPGWNSAKNHKVAARVLATKLGWNYGRWIAGDIRDGSTIWVCDAPGVDSFVLADEPTALDILWQERVVAP